MKGDLPNLNKPQAVLQMLFSPKVKKSLSILKICPNCFANKNLLFFQMFFFEFPQVGSWWTAKRELWNSFISMIHHFKLLQNTERAIFRRKVVIQSRYIFSSNYTFFFSSWASRLNQTNLKNLPFPIATPHFLVFPASLVKSSGDIPGN